MTGVTRLQEVTDVPTARNDQDLTDSARRAAPRRPRTAGAGGSSKQRGKAAAATAGRQSQQVATTAADEGQRVVGVAGRQAQEVKEAVKDQAAQLAQELSSQGRGLVEETRQQLHSQADEQTQSLAQALFRWGYETQALVDGRPDEAPMVRQYAQQCADKLNGVASEIEERGVEGLIDEVAQFARRRPGAFLLGAAVIGFGGGRLLRGAGTHDEPSAGATVNGERELVATTARRGPAPTGRSRRNPPSHGGE